MEDELEEDRDQRKKEKVEGNKKGESKNNSQYWTYHHSQTPGP